MDNQKSFVNLWQEVVTTALVGTERQPLKLPSLDNPLGELLTQLDQTDSEGALLSCAGAIALYQQAGQLPATDNQILPPPCELDDLPRCNPRAGQHLAMMLQGQQAELLTEWLKMANTTVKRAPEHCLPKLLDLGYQQRRLQDDIIPVLGKRGRWLAVQNPHWAYAIGGDEETIWQTGSSAARRSLLLKLRQQDPHHARELLESTWAKENFDDRATFIEALKMGLSMADEPFLEAALDDRRKEVRRAAADLLPRLADSRLCQRMTERVRFLVPLIRKKKIQIDGILPGICDQGMIRDGVEPKPPHSGIGDKAWWLQQMLGAVPPAIWYQVWNISKTELKLLVAAAIGNVYEQVLLSGWALATKRHQDEDWAEALLSLWPNKLSDELMKELLAVLNHEKRDAFVLSILQHHREELRDNNPAMRVMRQYQYPWSVNLTRAVIDRLNRQLTTSQNSYDWTLQSWLKECPRYINLSLVEEVTANFSQIEKIPHWAETIHEFLSFLHFRNEMIKELGDLQ